MIQRSYAGRRILGVMSAALVGACSSAGGGHDMAGTDASAPVDGATKEGCVPKTCNSVGASCDSISDGCGHTLSCGTCAPPATCGGGGTANVCGPCTTNDGGASSSVTFAIDLTKGPTRVFNPPSTPVAVSPYVYGVNSFAAWEETTKWGMLRWGGDAMTDWNWTNNFSNAGSDFCFWQGNEGGMTTLAGTIATGTPSVPADQKLGAASLVTVPILDFVSSGAFTNNVWSGSTPPCPGMPTCTTGNPNGTAMNVGSLPFASTDPSSAAFVANSATKGTALCTATTGTCAVDTAGPVYQDEFVNYMKVNYGSGAPVFFMLDNEPNYWPSTHPEVYASTGTPGCGTSGVVSFDDIVTRNTTYATAIKNTWPDAKVFGPVVAQDGILYAGNYSDPNLPTPFSQYYLAHMATASASAGHALIDSFDTHYYTNGSMNGGGAAPTAAQCLQAPRLFWDPNFTDYTAAQVGLIDFGYHNTLIDSIYPRKMIPRMLEWIATAYASDIALAPGYSISEYDMGCETQIEGGVAEADLLGVFGREGLFGATMWPLKTVVASSVLANYPVAAFDLYRNYDGKGGEVGDTTVSATTSDMPDTSVYAFTSSTHSDEVDVVAINKLSTPTSATITIAHAPSLTTANLYHLVDGTIAVTAVSAPPSIGCCGTSCTLSYVMPATSATTIVLQ